MSDDAPEQQPPSVSSKRLEVVEEKVLKTLFDVRVLVVLACTAVAGLFGGGWAAFAQVRLTAAEVAAEKAQVIADKQVASDVRLLTLEARASADAAAWQYELSKVRADVAEVRDDQRAQRTETRGMREDLRLLADGRPLPKLAKDGGGP